MPEIVFIGSDDRPVAVQAKVGATVMQTALNMGIDGIVAECGGAAQCATCHVYVEPAWLALLPEADEFEDAMLDSTASERRPDSRLSCQITMTPAPDGLTLRLPERQI